MAADDERSLETATVTVNAIGARRRARRSSTRLPQGTRVGRYVILDKLGAGGMGVVYKCHDFALDRYVALKLVRVEPSTTPELIERRDRLLREAQALAQLSHPNVVTVHDVGTHGEYVYVAMELVEGTTLRGWLRDEKPSRRRVIQALIAAGRGLAATHEVGLIHRDIKPANILVRRDGRVLVADFGLARATDTERSGELGLATPHESFGDLAARPHSAAARSMTSMAATTSAEHPTPLPLGDGERLLDAPMTAAGRIMGTPGYMAPEQHQGREATALSDQFSFCVMLFEALYGVRPFAGESREEIQLNTLTGTIREVPGPAVPARLRRIALRGLALEPADRYPSMNALIDDLAADPAVFRRHALSLGLMASLGGISVALVMTRGGAPAAPCQGSEDRLTAVWDPAVRAQVRTAFLAGGRPHAADVFDRVAAVLDHRATTWTAMRREACEATWVRHDQSEHVMDLRMACLDRVLGETRALTQLFATRSDADVVDNATQAALSLPRLEQCTDVAALMMSIPPPADPRTQTKVLDLRGRLETGLALGRIAKYPEARAILDDSVTVARTLRYAPIEAEALVDRGEVETLAGDGKAAAATLFEALPVAAQAHDDRLSAIALGRLVYVIGYLQARAPEALAIGLVAEAAVARAGGDPELEARVVHGEGATRFLQGDYPRAERDFARVLTIYQHAPGIAPTSVAKALTYRAAVLSELCRFDEAVADLERAESQLEGALGAGHPDVAIARINLGWALGGLHRDPEAERAYRRALAALEQTFGPTHRNVGATLVNLGDLEVRTGRAREGLVDCQRALDISRAAVGTDHPTVPGNLACVGGALLALGRPREALPLLEQAITLATAANAPPAVLAESRFLLARARWDRAIDRTRALAEARLARDEALQANNCDHSSLTEMTSWLATHDPR